MESEKYLTPENPPKILTADAGFNRHILREALELAVDESAGIINDDTQKEGDRKNEDIKRVENDLWHAERAGDHYITGSENLQFVINNLEEPPGMTSIIIIRNAGVEIIQRSKESSLEQ